MSDAFTKMTLILNIVFKTFWKDIVFPNNLNDVNKDFKGGYVADPTPGVHHNIAVLDYASLYPTVISTYNLSPLTFITSYEKSKLIGCDIDNDLLPKLRLSGTKYVDTQYNDLLFGKRYIFTAQLSQLGMIPKLMKFLFSLRRRIKKLMENPNLSKQLVNALNKRQYVYKITMNSTFGAFGNAYFRFFFPEIADSITFFARRSLMYAQLHMMLNFKLKNIYSDTDSVALDSMIRYIINNELKFGTIGLMFHLVADFKLQYFNSRETAMCSKKKNILALYYDNGVKLGNVRHVYRHKVKSKLYRITLDDGSSIDVTGDHSVATVDDNNNISYKKTKLLTLSDKMLKINRLH